MKKQALISQGMCPFIYFFTMLSFLLLICGCTQVSMGSSTTPTYETPVVIVEQPDASHIQITYHGSLKTDKLVELEITITDSNGKVTIQSMGSRMVTKPLPYGSSRTITGSFNEIDRVVVTGYFSEISQKSMVDILI